MGRSLTTAGRADYELRIWGGSNSMSKDLAKSVGTNELVASCSTAFAEVSKRISSSLQKAKKLYPDFRQQIFVEKASETALISNLRTNPETMTLRSSV
jgi:hypothetical protein